MKFKLLILVFLITTTGLFAQMKFVEGTWDEILSRAKAENQIVFVDAYAEWCGPCKMMARNVFTTAEVGDYYNRNFLNVKIDMEKGEGPAIANRYNVSAYPTFLFVDGNGNLVHRGIGSQSASDFIALGKVANDPDQRISGMDKRYKRGERDPDFLYDLAKSKIDLMAGNHHAVVKDYLDTQKDWSGEKATELIFHSVEKAEGELFDYFVENRAAFENVFSKEHVIRKVNQIAVTSTFGGGNTPDFEAIENIVKKFYPEEAKKTSANLKMNFYHRSGETDKFAQAAVDYYTQHPSENYNELNSTAWAFYTDVEDKKMLKKAIDWAKKSVEMNPGYANMDTLAALYSKLGKKRKTIKYANKAIELAKAEGQDYSETQKYIDMF